MITSGELLKNIATPYKNTFKKSVVSVSAASVHEDLQV